MQEREWGGCKGGLRGERGMRGRGGCQLFFPLGRETLQSKVSHRRPLSTNQFSFSRFYFSALKTKKSCKERKITLTLHSGLISYISFKKPIYYPQYYPAVNWTSTYQRQSMEDITTRTSRI